MFPQNPVGPTIFAACLRLVLFDYFDDQFPNEYMVLVMLCEMGVPSPVSYIPREPTRVVHCLERLGGQNSMIFLDEVLHLLHCPCKVMLTGYSRSIRKPLSRGTL